MLWSVGFFFHCLGGVWSMENPGLTGCFTCWGFMIMKMPQPTNFLYSSAEMMSFGYFYDKLPKLKAYTKMKLICNKAVQSKTGVFVNIV